MKMFLFLKLGLVGIAMLGSPAMAKGRKEEEVSNNIFGGVQTDGNFVRNFHTL
jgi:hypothetical protein